MNNHITYKSIAYNDLCINKVWITGIIEKSCWDSIFNVYICTIITVYWFYSAFVCLGDALCIIRSGVVIIWPYLTKYYIQHCSDYGRRKEKEHPCLTLPLGVYPQFVRENEFYWCHTLFKHSLTPWSERISNMNFRTDMIQFWYWNQEPSSANEFPWDRSVGSACQRSTRGVLGSLWRNAVKQSLTLNLILDQ